MDEQDPRLEGERADPSISRAASPGSAASAVDDGEPRLRQLQEEVVEARVEVAATLGAIEDRLRPSSIAASAAEAVTDKAAAIGDSISTSEPARYARANPWATVLVLTGAAVAVWLMMTPRRRAHRRDGRRNRRRGEGHEFTRTHYDAGTEYPLESAATRVPGAAPAADSKSHSQTYGGTTA